MVKFVGLSEKEKAERERVRKLEKIIRAEFGEGEKISTGKKFVSYYPDKQESGKQLFIYTTDNSITICGPELLYYARRLAERFESEGEPEFTIRKDYEE